MTTSKQSQCGKRSRGSESSTTLSQEELLSYREKREQTIGDYIRKKLIHIVKNETPRFLHK